MKEHLMMIMRKNQLKESLKNLTMKMIKLIKLIWNTIKLK